MTTKAPVRLRATVCTPTSHVYTVIISYCDEKGATDHNMPVITIPAKSYQHARAVADAYNAGGDIVA